MKRFTGACMIALILTVPGLAAEADDLHPAMSSKFWGNLGVFVSTRDFDASAKGTVGGITKSFDFESSTGLDDSSNILMAELGWHFTPKWGLALQYFASDRSASKTLTDSIEWQDLVFDVGVQIDAEASFEITRVWFARQFYDKGPHSLHLGAGFHWLSLSASLAGEATLNDLSREFRRSVVKAEFPMPNVGALYRYSPSRRWMFNLRTDWLSASVDEYTGEIWNAAAGVNFSPRDHLSFGLSYQFFQLNGEIEKDRWRGEVQTTFNGPVIYISGYW